MKKEMNKHEINLEIVTELEKEVIFEGLKRLCSEQFREFKIKLGDLEYTQERT